MYIFTMRFITLSLLCLFTVATVPAQPGESAVITLVFPSGARLCGMGEVGTALADDENVMFYNPAGLGVPNKRWHYGGGSSFWEPLLPAFGLRDLWHFHLSAAYQPPFTNIGGFGIDYNYINMGTNTMTDPFGNESPLFRSYEYVLGLGWGFDPFNTGSSFFGVNLKYVHSALAPGIGPNNEGVAQSFAIDLGYLLCAESGLRFGLTFMNMGPSVYYITRENSDPMPFTVNWAVAYKDTTYIENMHAVDFAVELRVGKEFARLNGSGEPDPFIKALFTEWTESSFTEEVQEMIVHTGGEVTMFKTVSLRSGFLFDYIGERYEWTMGFGIKLFDHIQYDFSYIYSPDGFMADFLHRLNPGKNGATGARHGQWRMQLSLMNILDWDKEDFYPFNLIHTPPTTP